VWKKTVLRIGVDVRPRDFMTILRHRVANKSSERLKKLITKLTNLSLLENEIKNRKYIRIALHHPVLNLPCFRLPHGSKSLNYKNLQF